MLVPKINVSPKILIIYNLLMKYENYHVKSEARGAYSA